jgi:calcium-dependent protein kinase
MLASDAPDAPLKAVDFGLAVFFEPGELPRRDLGFEGTPWFMAPEARAEPSSRFLLPRSVHFSFGDSASFIRVLLSPSLTPSCPSTLRAQVLRSEVGPEADVWAAGVMAHQLLSGRMPFDDRSSPAAPAVSKIWRSVLLDKLDFTKPCWEGVSDDAKDFVSKLLEKDPAKRPSAREALKHPWLAGGIEERGRGRALGLSVVQRVQRYAAASAFKRSALELIAQELIADAEREHEEKENEEGGAATPAAAAAATPAAAAAATAARPAAACALGPDGRALVDGVDAGALEYLYARLRLADRAAVDRAALAGGLAELGYRLAPAEVERLLDALDPGQTGAVSRAGLAASQLDWRAVRSARAEAWLRGARAAFAGLDADADGRVSSEDMVALLRHKLPPSEIDAAVRQALAEGARREGGSAHGGSAGGSAHGGAGSAHGGAGSAGASAHGGAARGGAGAGAPPASPGDPSLRDGLNFRQFLRMLRSGASADSLDLYDDRFAGSASAHGAGGSGAGAGGARAALAAAASAGSPARSPGSYEHIDLLLERSVRAGSGAVGALAAPLGTLAEENGGDAPFD